MGGHAKKSGSQDDTVRRNPRRRCTLHNLWEGGKTNQDNATSESPSAPEEAMSALALEGDEIEVEDTNRSQNPKQEFRARIDPDHDEEQLENAENAAAQANQRVSATRTQQGKNKSTKPRKHQPAEPRSKVRKKQHSPERRDALPEKAVPDSPARKAVIDEEDQDEELLQEYMLVPETRTGDNKKGRNKNYTDDQPEMDEETTKPQAAILEISRARKAHVAKKQVERQAKSKTLQQASSQNSLNKLRERPAKRNSLDLEDDSVEQSHKSISPLPAPPQRDQRQSSKRPRRDLDALEASVQAQVAARSALQVHTNWLEKRNKDYAKKAEKASMWENAFLMALEDMQSTRLRQSALEARCFALETALLKSETTRRQLHEDHMTRRGNMRVFCRLRPGSGSDAFDTTSGGSIGDLRVRAPPVKSVDGRSEASKLNTFNFDCVFPESASQEDVFAEVQGLIQSALDGFNVCIFAYGQTGSGKTHTMSNLGSGDHGIIPRALETIAEQCKQELSKTVRHKMRLSLLEIYNEELRDLLAAKQTRGSKRAINSESKGPGTKSAPGGKLRLRIDPRRGTPQIEGLQEIPIEDIKHAHELLAHAEKSRSVARTSANERSSRSHTVLTLMIDHIDKDSGEISKTSHVHLVDLAGSERIAHAGSDRSAKQLKEQCSINTSLVALKNVLRALATQQNHIPFRDSKLTHLLQDALESKSCKTLMLCAVSQDQEHILESLNTLRFASQVLQN